MSRSPHAAQGSPVLARNPRARHDFHILETWEAGLVLTGSEIKSIRERKVSLREAFGTARVIAFLLAAHCALHPVAPCVFLLTPGTLVVATRSGETVIPLTIERGHPALPAPYLSRVLPLTTDLKPDWATVTFAGQPFK